jgi:hypothetical protein
MLNILDINMYTHIFTSDTVSYIYNHTIMLATEELLSTSLTFGSFYLPFKCEEIINSVLIVSKRKNTY